MLEKPDLQDHEITDGLRVGFGFNTVEVFFLPLGADRNTAVYRVITSDGTAYFVKLRRGVFDPVTVSIPRFLQDQGAAHVIAPLPTVSGQLWVDLGDYKMIVYPYVEGYHGFQVDLGERHWIAFGRALRELHSAKLPPEFMSVIPQENYSPQWRELVRGFQAQVADTSFNDQTAAELGHFLKTKTQMVSRLVTSAERLGAVLETQQQSLILCHADMHVGNILIDKNDWLYLVDWDTLNLAPQERDLMFVGGGLGGGKFSPTEEERLFYEGYGQVHPDPVGLGYYRCERIVQDIAAYCEQILWTDGASLDRQEGLRQLKSQFEPGNVIEIALETLKHLPSHLQSILEP